MELKLLGWDSFFREKYKIYEQSGLLPARVISENRHICELEGEEGAFTASLSGHFQYTAASASDYPVTGDWVLFRSEDETAVIEKVLERKTSFSRRAAGREWEEQVLASNINFLCIINAMDGGRNFSIRGMERFITLAHSGGAEPVIILNKADLAEDPEDMKSRACASFTGVPVFSVSAAEGRGLEELKQFFPPGSTLAFAGPSGVGKSTLVNALNGSQIQKTGAVRGDDKRGRHTTTKRQLFFIPGDLMIIDTPGLREMQLWADESSLDEAFEEIAEASRLCRFRDCTHTNEPGCAVLEMLEKGDIEPDRYESYLSMRGEISYLQSKVTEKGRIEKKAKDKNLARMVREVKKMKQ